MSRLAACIDRGLDVVQPVQETIRHQVEAIQEVAAALDPATGDCTRRQAAFQGLIDRFEVDSDPVHQQMAQVMRSFRPGLFVGGDQGDQVRDNLDLERWFR